MKLGALFSGGKDSVYAVDLAERGGGDVAVLMTMLSSNEFSYMFHSAAIGVTKMQADAMEKPIIFRKTEGEKEKELSDLTALIEDGVKQYGIKGVVTGALFSEYQARRIKKICETLGLECFSPNWHVPQEAHMRRAVKDGYVFVLSAVSAAGLDESWLNRPVDAAMIDRLVAIDRKQGFNVAGEGGEFETLVVDGPIFRRPVVIDDFGVQRDGTDACRLVVKKAHLGDKK